MKVLIQARVSKETKAKISKLAAANSRALSNYIALVLEHHAKSTDLKAIKALVKAWDGVKEDQRSVVRKEDGPR